MPPLAPLEALLRSFRRRREPIHVIAKFAARMSKIAHACTLLGLATAAAAAGTPQDPAPTLALTIGRGREFVPPWPVRGVSVTDPLVADVEVLQPELLFVSGRGSGVTDLVVWSETGETRRWAIEVQPDLDGLGAELASLFPGASFDLSSTRGVLMVRGVLSRARDAEDLARVLESMETPYVDLTSVAGPQQVQVKIRIAEVDRVYLRALGMNALGSGSDAFGGSVIGSSAGGPLNPISIGLLEETPISGDLPFAVTDDLGISPAVTLFAGFPSANIELFIQALSENQLLRIMAEPTLTARSGEAADFLAGGEFPIPVIQGGGVGGNAITIEYKKFGVGLAIKPVVLGEGMISMTLESEVSELSNIGGVEIQGFRVPSILTRRTETTLELGSGQSFAIAGLLSETTNAAASKVPFLGSLPVIGALFRSVRYQRSQTELLVVVTASLVEPLTGEPTPPLPGAAHVPPSDWNLYATGNIEGTTPARTGPAESRWLRGLGLDGLQGPGPWASHGDRPFTR